MATVGHCFGGLAPFLWLLTATCVSAQPPTETKVPDPVREQTIYIPYDQLRDVFEREGRGVFLPYDQFQKLWQEARSAKHEPNRSAPPVDAILVSAENIATIEKQVMVVRSTITVELLNGGWQKIPLQLNDAAITSATIDKIPARIVHDPATGYALLVQNTEDKPVTKIVELEYAKAYEKTPGQNSVSIMAPQAPVNQWRILIAEPGVKVQVEPMLATSESPNGNDGEKKTDRTEVLAFIGATPNIRIRWVPKSEGATGMAPLANVQMQHRTIIEEGIVRTNAQFVYTIDRSELNQLAISVPADQKVINVFDPNVRKWSMEPNADKNDASQKLIVELFEPARKLQNLVIELETPLDTKAGTQTSVQPLVCLDASRQQGVVAIRIGQGIRAEPSERRGLMQMDAAELPQPLAAEPWGFAYRFTSVPFDLKLKLDKVLPTIRVEQMVEAILEPQSLTLELATTHKIENAGVFQLEFDIPPDFELVQVVGRTADNVVAASIDAYRFANETKDRLIVSLNRRAIGKVGTFIQLKKKLSDPNLVSPTGASSNIAVPVPRSTGEHLQWIDGIIVVYAPEGLRMNPVEKLGVRDGVTNEVRAPFGSTCLQRYPGIVESVVFAHAMDPVKLSLDVERKRPYVTVRQMLSVMVEPGSVKYTATLEPRVQYSSVNSIRIDVPESLVRDIRVESPGVRQVTMVPAPDDVAAGYVAWELVPDVPWIGQRSVQLGWVGRLEGLDIGKATEFSVPSIVPRKIDHAWGQIVLNRKDSIDLQTIDGTSGLRPIDPRYDLNWSTSFPDAVRAFEFQAEWALKVAATRYALEEVKQTSIERAFVRAVVTRSGRTGIHAMYRMRNARQRLLVALPEGAEFDSQPLMIGGKNVSLERGSGNQLYIPLAGLDPAQAILVELRYTTLGDQKQLNLPEFPEVPAVQAAYLGVFLPKERLLLSSDGPWTEEFNLRPQTGWKFEPQCNQSSAQLVQWVKENVPMAATVDFQTDGVMYLYSTLKPEPAPKGTLRLIAITEQWWAAAILGFLLLVGVLFLRHSFTTKWIVVAFIVAGALVTGVFAPTFASQLMIAPSWIGGALVAILWSTKWFFGMAKTWRERPTIPFVPDRQDKSVASTSSQSPGENSVGSESNGSESNGPNIPSGDSTNGGSSHA